MKYQSFKDFLAELDACQAKVRDVTFCDIIKIVTVDNETVKIDLSSGELKVETTILGSIQPKSLRLHYAAHPAEFNSMLDELKKTCDQVAEAAEGILEALTSHAVPAKMIEAMKGENVDADPKVIIKELTCARVHELATEAARGLRLGSIIMTTEIENKTLSIHLAGIVSWGDIKGFSHPITESESEIKDSSIEDCLVFLSLVPKISQKISAMISQVRNIKRMLRS